METLSTQERLNDICKISGLSENIVRRVMEAERESIVNSLKHGQKATLIGRVILTPEMMQKLQIGGSIKRFIRVKAKITSSLEHMIENTTEFEVSDYDEFEEENFITKQIDSLV